MTNVLDNLEKHILDLSALCEQFLPLVHYIPSIHDVLCSTDLLIAIQGDIAEDILKLREYINEKEN